MGTGPIGYLSLSEWHCFRLLQWVLFILDNSRQANRLPSSGPSRGCQEPGIAYIVVNDRNNISVLWEALRRQANIWPAAARLRPRTALSPVSSGIRVATAAIIIHFLMARDV